MNTMIKCLPIEVQGKLRSGVAVPSLQQCVEELVLNSIDAGANCVGVRLNMEALKIQVIDNGAGMSPEDLERVGNRYHTSKCSSLEDLDDLRWYGFRGEALASVVSLAALVEITSRTISCVNTHVKMFKNGKGLDVFKAETTRPSAGTTIVICNFFYNMPVRRKRVDAVLEGERIRHRVEAISLMHPSVSFSLKNDCTGAMTVQLPKAKDTYHRFVQIHGLGRAQKLGEIGYTHGQFEVNGYIGREGHYNNSLQFLYVNGRLLLKTQIHKLLNFLLRRLSSSNQKNDSPDGQSANRSPKHKRNQDLHGVYIINIKCSYSEYDICLDPAKTLIEFRDWDGILLCVEEAVKVFLRRENLVAVLSQDDMDYVSPQLFGTDSTDQEGNNNSAEDGQATSTAFTLDCSVGLKLASESVYRKRGDVSEDSVCQESDLMDCGEEGAEKMPTNNLEKPQGEDCRDEPQHDLDELEPTCDNNRTEVEEPTFGKAGEKTLFLCTTSQLQLTEEKEILNSITSTSNVTLPNSTTQQIQADFKSAEQLLPSIQDAVEHGHTLTSNRKISLSDSFIHQGLQTKDLPQINNSVFQQQNLAHKGDERSLASKHKISLDSSRDTSCLKLCEDFDPVVPVKIPRFISCQRISLNKESGSLDQFRKEFGKTDEMKSPSLDTHLENNAWLPQENCLISNPQNLTVCQKDQQDVNITQPQKQETQNSFQSVATPSVFTKLKPASAQKKRKTSLAAKLCLLKQHRAETSKALSHFSRPTSQDSVCLSSGKDIQDSNNNDNPCETALDALLGSKGTNPELGEREEDITSGDWIHHYDTSVGKNVYVNRVTGLSTYEDPSAEETQVQCTSDVTNMAVSVISETGTLVGMFIDILVMGNSHCVILCQINKTSHDWQCEICLKTNINNVIVKSYGW